MSQLDFTKEQWKIKYNNLLEKFQEEMVKVATYKHLYDETKLELELWKSGQKVLKK